MLKIKDIAAAIEEFAPRELQESYDNAGIQVGNPEMPVTAVLLCLDVTEAVLDEAASRGCNLIVSHHPLIFKGLRQLSGADAVQRMVISALGRGIAVYSAHTNLDSAWGGVSHEIARLLGLKDIRVLDPKHGNTGAGIGVTGSIGATPVLEFLRKVKDTFKVKCLRYSSQSPRLVVRKAAVCGGSGASLIKEAVEAGCDAIVTGDVKYHDFTSYGSEIVIADIGHYESELCTKEILSRIIRGKYPDCATYFAESETNPVKFM